MLRSSLFWLRAIAALLTGRRSFTRQIGRTDCGVACALTALKMMSRPTDPVGAVEALDPERSGTSLEALRCYLGDCDGLEAKALAVPARRVAEIPGRIILHMAQQHYVVLLLAGRSGLLVFDPAIGPVLYRPADFESLYSGHLLSIRARGATRRRLRDRPWRIGGVEPAAAVPLALFLVGFATRLLEFAVLLCLVAVLFLVLNHASLSSLTTAAVVIAVCGALLLVAHRIRFGGEDSWIRLSQGRLLRGALLTVFRGRDLSGFRGLPEREVTGSLRKGLGVIIPQRALVPAALGSVCAVPALLWFLDPVVAAIHLALFGAVLVVLQLDAVQLCRRSIPAGVGRYSKLSLGHALVNSVSAPDLIGELAKWTVIGFAGFGVLFGDLPEVALMFWILAAMQIVPSDFRRAMALAPGIAESEPIPDLAGSEVPLRRQKLLGPVDLRVSRAPGLVRIDGIGALTQSLQQPDLTVREQRLIMADVVRRAVRDVDVHGPAGGSGRIRIFGPGQDATQSDFEHLMIARETRTGQTLPVPVDTRGTIARGARDPVLRDLHSCEPGDFPVFWDLRERLALADLQSRLGDVGVTRAGHLTMKRLTLVEAA